MDKMAYGVAGFILGAMAVGGGVMIGSMIGMGTAHIAPSSVEKSASLEVPLTGESSGSGASALEGPRFAKSANNEGVEVTLSEDRCEALLVFDNLVTRSSSVRENLISEQTLPIVIENGPADVVAEIRGFSGEQSIGSLEITKAAGTLMLASEPILGKGEAWVLPSQQIADITITEASPAQLRVKLQKAAVGSASLISVDTIRIQIEGCRS